MKRSEREGGREGGRGRERERERQRAQSVLNIESGAEKSVHFWDVYRAYCAHRPIHMML